jgi:hypothetical protein
MIAHAPALYKELIDESVVVSTVSFELQMEGPIVHHVE